MFKERSNKKELLDQEEIPSFDLFQNLKELNTINTLLGGYRITISALNKITKPSIKYSIVDIGCGGGDALKYVKKWGEKRGFRYDLIGVDLKPMCIGYAKSDEQNKDIRFICDDYKNISKHVRNINIIHASLFCHHLTEADIIDLIKFANRNQSILVINDLERNRFAYYAIKILTAVFSKSYLVKNDAPLSVLRGFKKSEWITIIKEAGANNYSIRSKWAFRHEIIIYAN